MSQKIVIIIGKGGGIEVVSDSPIQVHLLDRNHDGAEMISVVEGAVCDIQVADVVIDPERLNRICAQVNSALISIDDMNDTEFDIDKDFDMSASASHKGPFFTVNLQVSRQEPDAANDTRRAKVDFTIDIERASDGRRVHQDRTANVADDGLRGFLEDWIDEHASDRSALSKTFDLLNETPKKNIRNTSLGM